MSKIATFAKSLNLKVTSAKVDAINPIIFQAKVNVSAFGDVVMVDGTPNLIDVSANTAVPLTPASVKEQTIAGLTADKMTPAQTVAVETSETCGTITKIVFEKGKGSVNCPQSVLAFAKANNMKIDAATVDTQNEIIFSTLGVKSISGLTDHDGTLYQLDVSANTATVVNAQALSDKAVVDFLANKEATDATKFAEAFGLITSLTLVKNK